MQRGEYFGGVAALVKRVVCVRKGFALGERLHKIAVYGAQSLVVWALLCSWVSSMYTQLIHTWRSRVRHLGIL